MLGFSTGAQEEAPRKTQLIPLDTALCLLCALATDPSSEALGNVKASQESLRGGRLWSEGLEGGSAQPQTFLVPLGTGLLQSLF